MAFPSSNGDDVDEFTRPQTKYVPLQELYKTAPVVQSGEPSVVSKTGKVRRRTNSDHQDDRERSSDEIGVSNVRNTYSRSRSGKKPSVFGNLRKQSGDEKVEAEEGEGEGWRRSKRRKVARPDGMDLGDDDSTGVGGIREGRSNRNRSKSKDVGDGEIKTSHQELRSKRNKSKGSVGSAKEWTRLIIDGDAKKFIGFKCKVYWPLDDTWYCGHIVGYNPETDRHHVKYLDGDEEHLVLSKQRISFFVSPEEIQFLGLSAGVQCSDTDSIDKEVVDLAATLVDSADHFVPGDILWEAINGNATRPAIVVDESASFNLKGLYKISGEKTVLVQFFGTYEFARLREEQTVPFFKGCLQQRFKCMNSDFVRSLEETKTYISNQKLPKAMLSVRKRNTSKSATANGEQEGSDEGTRAKEIRKSLDGLRNCPLEIGDLQIISLGKIAGDSNCFVDCNYICPEGYTAVRKFPSVADPSKRISYKMEVLRDEGNALNKPIFRVTSEKGEQFEGPDSSSCWDKIYRKVRKMQRFSSDAPKSYGPPKNINISGPGMFGFSHPEILKLIQPSELSMLTSKRYQDLPVGYRPVHITWKDLDKCNVCHMEEEYENNLLLQCDNCRMMVHSRCYGEQEPVDGVLWYCNLCRSGAPEYPTPCCLCPCIGGAMKPTTDGRWAHLACAIWIPETSLVDVKRMEPIDGVNRINKDRWKLVCSICGVSYGACIQCANSSCYIAYHPLCARVAGFCLELEGEDRLHLIPGDKDEYNQNIQLLSFCKRHRPLSNQLIGVKDHIGQSAHHQLDYIPPPNPSGCARTESYNYLTRRGRKEPEAHGLSLKRLYVENRPYLVGGYTQHDSFSNVLSSKGNTSRDIFSMAEKYKHMSRTFRKRLAFGKSRIHGYGVFAKKTHLAGDMVIEYTGEVVRAPIADRREHLIYNSFVGAGTYMFRIDDERVIDATKAGSIAHLINHSCEPNCYSRVITITGDEHIIIFAKRDIQQWEELTYDYRFFSIDEQLACYCGFPTCRGVVNDIGPHEPIAKLCVPRSDLTVESDSGDENEW